MKVDVKRFGNFLKRVWANPVAKTTIVAAGGAVFGVLEPVIISGAPLTAALLHSAIRAAVLAVGALWIHKPGAAPDAPADPKDQKGN